MKKSWILSAFSALALVISGCSDSEKPIDNAASSPKDVATLISLLAPIQTTIISSADTPTPAVKVIETLKALKQVTGIEFYARAPRTFDANSPAGKVLGARNPKFIPFFAEDVTTNTIYIAPEAVQNAIIAQWSTWAAKNAPQGQLPPPAQIKSSPAIRQADPTPIPSTTPVVESKKSQKTTGSTDASELLLD